MQNNGEGLLVARMLRLRLTADSRQKIMGPWIRIFGLVVGRRVRKVMINGKLYEDKRLWKEGFPLHVLSLLHFLVKVLKKWRGNGARRTHGPI